MQPAMVTQSAGCMSPESTLITMRVSSSAARWRTGSCVARSRPYSSGDGAARGDDESPGTVARIISVPPVCNKTTRGIRTSAARP